MSYSKPTFFVPEEVFDFLSKYEIHGSNENYIELTYMIIEPIITLPKHITERNYPEQTKMFKEILDKMYQTHLEKNADYSPANMLGTGSLGAVVKFWDKAARIMSLMGFDIYTGKYSGEKEAKNEAVEDSFMDAAVYCIIFLLIRAGKWGK